MLAMGNKVKKKKQFSKIICILLFTALKIGCVFWFVLEKQFWFKLGILNIFSVWYCFVLPGNCMITTSSVSVCCMLMEFMSKTDIVMLVFHILFIAIVTLYNYI